MRDPVDSVILTYHSIDSSGSAISTSAELFAEQMQFIASGPYRVVELSKIGLAPGSLAITFDDGYGNFRTEALPVLERLRMPSTVFVVAGACGEFNGWDAGRPDLPQLRLMDWSELSEVAGRGVTIGAHTTTHANLAGLDATDAEREIASCREALQNRLYGTVDQFAYPYGASNPAVREMVARYYRLACGTEMSFATGRLDPFQLPRIDTYYLRARGVFRKFAAGQAGSYLAVRRTFRAIRLWMAQ